MSGNCCSDVIAEYGALVPFRARVPKRPSCRAESPCVRRSLRHLTTTCRHYLGIIADADIKAAHAKYLSGIRLTRDSEVSVVYAEGLNSTTSSVMLQRTDRHGIVGQKPPDFQESL
jgi:hypothetical protein